MRERLFCMESPTHVGNTHGVLRRGSAPAVHPHACGEYGPHCSAEIMQGGSSPRVWGILHVSHAASFMARFIPTRVGNTQPRRRMAVLMVGSSPRVWGILRHGAGAFALYRFIPTRVGNTSSAFWRLSSRTVHPHACGEYVRQMRANFSARGSSPRVWGIPQKEETKMEKSRFIPTRVGNTLERACSAR